MAGGRSEDEGGCRVRFRIEWAMWGNLNALYAAASKSVASRDREREREREGGGRERGRERQTDRHYMKKRERVRERRMVCGMLGEIFFFCIIYERR